MGCKIKKNPTKKQRMKNSGLQSKEKTDKKAKDEEQWVEEERKNPQKSKRRRTVGCGGRKKPTKNVRNEKQRVVEE
ncbi:MAG: hypothetical protein LUD01_01015 [Clostridiales bacterium]|nr:hypothetical protein [Clostridiales bacterium]